MKWKKLFLWTLTIIGLAIVGGYLFLTSSYFNRYLLRKAVEKAEDATGARVEIGSFTLHLLGPSVDIHHFVMHGNEPPGKPPLFEAEHIQVGFDLSSILHREIQLTQLKIDRPIFHLVLDKEGRSNLPQPASKAAPTGAGKIPSLLFSLAIGHLQLSQGELILNDKQAKVEADLRNVSAVAQYDPTNLQYDASLSYLQGEMRYNDWNSVHHDLHAKFAAVPGTLTVKELAVSVGSSLVSLRGVLRKDVSPAFHGTYNLNLDLLDARRIMRNASVPAGDIQSTGTLAYNPGAQGSWLQGLTTQGEFHSSELVESMPQFRGRVRSIRGHFHMTQGNLIADNLHADLLGGNASAKLNIEDIPGTPQYRLEASFQNLSLDTLRTAVQKGLARGYPVSGHIDGKLNADWRGHFDNLQIASDVAVSASAPSSAASGTQEKSVPVEGQAHVKYNAARGTLTLQRTYLRTPHSEILLNGTVSNQSSLRVAAQTSDLQDVEMLLQGALRATSQDSAASSMLAQSGLRGAASFQGEVAGSFSSPQLKGTLTAEHFQVKGTEWQSLHAALSLSPSKALVENGVLRGAGGPGQINFGGQVALNGWTFHMTNPVRLNAKLSDVPVSTLQQLTGADYPLKGLVSGEASIHGTLNEPVADGQISVEKAQAWNQPIQRATVSFQTESRTIKSQLKLLAGPGALQGNLVYHLADESYQLSAQAEKIHVEKLAAFKSPGLALEGALSFSLQGSGTLKSPNLQLSAQIPKLQVRQETFENVNLRAELANRQARLKLKSAVSGTALDAVGTIDLKGNYPADISLHTGRIDLQPFLANYFPSAPSDLSGVTEAQGWLKGPLRQPRLLQGQLDFPVLSVGYQSLQFKNQEPLRLTYQDGVVSLSSVELRGPDTELKIGGSISLTGSQPLNLAVHGNANLAVLQMFNKKIESGGQLRLELTARGSRSKPQVEGNINIVNANFYTDQFPVNLEQLNTKLSLHGSRLDIDQFEARSGGGRLKASGYLTYSSHLLFNVALVGDSIRVRYPQGVRSQLDSNLTLAGDLSEARLSGRVLINHLSLTNEFDLGSLASQLSQPSLPPSNKGFTNHLHLDVQIESTQEHSLSSSKLSIQGSANLRARGTAAQPVIVGRLVARSGEIFFNGQRYQIERGIVDFTNPSRTQPVLNFQVATTVDQYDLKLNLVGPLDRLRTHYSSEPPLPPVDVINLLAFGKTAEATAASSSNVPPSMGAESLLAKEVTSQLSSGVEKLVGISHLQIDPLLGGTQRNPGARLAIQQRIAGNLLLTYATDVRSTQNELIQVEYQATPRFSISVTRDQNGGIATDLRFHKSF